MLLKLTERRFLVHEAANPSAASLIFLSIVFVITVVVFVFDNLATVVFASIFYHSPTI
jgi:hypothetical protein